MVTPLRKKLMGKHEKATARPVRGGLYIGAMCRLESVERKRGREEERKRGMGQRSECMNMNSDPMADNSGDAEVQIHANPSEASIDIRIIGADQ